MEAIHTATTHLEIYASGKEYFALLRPGGMLAVVIAGSGDDLAAKIEVKKLDESGAIFRFPAASAGAIIAGAPRHACDDRLRYLLARWASAV
jgi:hypothetical protein